MQDQAPSTVNRQGTASTVGTGLTQAVPETFPVWQPIATAPKDGTPILIFQPDRSRCHHMPDGALGPNECLYRTDDPRLQWYDDNRWAIGYWRPWGGWGNRNSATVTPTHWMRLPLPPTEES